MYAIRSYYGMSSAPLDGAVPDEASSGRPASCNRCAQLSLSPWGDRARGAAAVGVIGADGAGRGDCNSILSYNFV